MSTMQSAKQRLEVRLLSHLDNIYQGLLDESEQSALAGSLISEMRLDYCQKVAEPNTKTTGQSKTYS